jgi:pseudaminic acid cytidylyltransferase
MTTSDYAASSNLVEEAVRYDAVVATVVRYGHPIQRALRSGASGLLEPREGQMALATRTQDLEPMWHDAGQFYWASPSRWSAPQPLLSTVVPFEVPEWRVQDIDTEEDWIRAEMIYSLAQSRSAE